MTDYKKLIDWLAGRDVIIANDFEGCSIYKDHPSVGEIAILGQGQTLELAIEDAIEREKAKQPVKPPISSLKIIFQSYYAALGVALGEKAVKQARDKFRQSLTDLGIADKFDWER